MNKDQSHNLESHKHNFKTLFFAKKKPKISILKYLDRILKNTNLEPSTLISSVVYLDKIANTKGVLLNENNIHR